FESCLPDHKSSTYADSSVEQAGNVWRKDSPNGPQTHGIVPEDVLGTSRESVKPKRRRGYWYDEERIEREKRPVQYATVRDDGDEWHIECRFKDGQKFAAITVDKDHEDLADWIAAAITALSGEGKQ
ncbi:hypothetical protein, partial [Sphingobium bisphenolivorans]|uniref:hypothetical protein n=1 Tax=Sphingobium bisphenolivorans TaxID=1335760 RepID=UPI001930A699